MDFLAQHAAAIMTALGTVSAAVVSVTSLIKAIKSEKRTKVELARTNEDVKITRQGIVQGFKEAVITKDLKVSVNKQVKELMNEAHAELLKQIKRREERQIKMTYWTLRILKWTAAANKLTTEQQAEVNELLALIAEEEQIVETLD